MKRLFFLLVFSVVAVFAFTLWGLWRTGKLSPYPSVSGVMGLDRSQRLESQIRHNVLKRDTGTDQAEGKSESKLSNSDKHLKRIKERAQEYHGLGNMTENVNLSKRLLLSISRTNNHDNGKVVHMTQDGGGTGQNSRRVTYLPPKNMSLGTFMRNNTSNHEVIGREVTTIGITDGPASVRNTSTQSRSAARNSSVNDNIEKKQTSKDHNTQSVAITNVSNGTKSRREYNTSRSKSSQAHKDDKSSVVITDYRNRTTISRHDSVDKIIDIKKTRTRLGKISRQQNSQINRKLHFRHFDKNN